MTKVFGSGEENEKAPVQEGLLEKTGLFQDQGDLFADMPVCLADSSEPRTHTAKQLPEDPACRAVKMAATAEPLGEYERYLTDKEVAERYGIARQTVWKRVKNHMLPVPVKFPPGTTRWRLSTLIAFEDAIAKSARGNSK